jgi:uncharacterized membrane protein SirB2
MMASVGMGKGMICSITNKAGHSVSGRLAAFRRFFRCLFHVRDTTIIFHGSGLALVVRTQKGWLVTLFRSAPEFRFRSSSSNLKHVMTLTKFTPSRFPSHQRKVLGFLVNTAILIAMLYPALMDECIYPQL